METTVLENPVLKEDAAFEAELLAAAQKADVGEDYTLPSADTDGTRATVETEQQPTASSPETTPEKKVSHERPRDEQGRFTKREDGTDIPESLREPAKLDKPDVAKADASKPAEPKTESEYVRKLKEAERKDRSWQQLEEEKRTARAEIEQERQRIAQERAQIQQWQNQQRQAEQQRNQGNQPQYSSKDYAEFAKVATAKAKQARERGDYDEADNQTELAAQAANKALEQREVEASQQYQATAQWHEKAWETEMQERMRETPDLQNRESPMAKEVMQVLSAYPGVFERIPPTKFADGKVIGGFGFAAEVAKLRLKAGAASGLEQKLKEVTAERDSLRGKTSLAGSSPTSPGKAKSIDDMSIAELEAHLQRQGELADAGR